jgi:hypothetical protein
MDIDREKALAVLAQLESEKDRRLQAKIDSGEVVVREVRVVVGRDDDPAAATERALAKNPVTDGIHNELLYIFSGIPHAQEHWTEGYSTPQVQAPKGPLSTPSEEAAGSGEVLSLSPPSEPAYIFVTTRAATNDDPGQIAEALWSVDDGCVVVTTLEGKHITSRALLKDEEPATVARSLLREREAPKDFQRPLHYPKLGLA